MRNNLKHEFQIHEFKIHDKYLSPDMIYIVYDADNTMWGFRWCRSYEIVNSISIITHEKSKKVRISQESASPS